MIIATGVSYRRLEVPELDLPALRGPRRGNAPGLPGGTARTASILPGLARPSAACIALQIVPSVVSLSRVVGEPLAAQIGGSGADVALRSTTFRDRGGLIR